MPSSQELIYSRNQFPNFEADLLRDNTLLIGGEYVLVQPGQISYFPVVLSWAKGNTLRFIGYKGGIEDISIPIWEVSKRLLNNLDCRIIQRKLTKHGEREFSELLRKLILLSKRWEIEEKVFNEDKIPLMSWQSFTGE